MSEYKANEQELKKAEVIRRQYMPKEENRLAQLQKLDSKVKRPGTIAAAILGTVGCLVMGGGMAQVMVWENMTLGLGLSIPGMIAALLAYPVYSLITGSRKKKYADEIMRLSSEVTA